MKKILITFSILIFVFSCGDLNQNDNNSSSHNDGDNNKPEFNSIEIPTGLNKGQTFDFRVYASDDDNDIIYYTFAATDGVFAVQTDKTSNYRNWTSPNVSGTVTVTVSISDDKDTVTEQRFVYVRNGMPNIESFSTDIGTKNYNETVAISLNGYDYDIVDSLYCTIQVDSGTLSFTDDTNTSASLSFITSSNIPVNAIYTSPELECTPVISYYISDGSDTVSDSTTLIVRNHAPYISNIYPEASSTTQSSTQVITVNGGDLDGGELYYTFSASTGTIINYSLNTDSACTYVSTTAMGTNYITATVSDGYDTVMDRVAIFVWDSEAPMTFTISLSGTVGLYDTGIYLTWTAPGDDYNWGQATSYEIRVSSALVTSDNFDSAIIISSNLVPKVGGETEYFFLPNASKNNYLAIRTTDDVGNASISTFDIRTNALASIRIGTYGFDEEGEKVIANSDGSYLFAGEIDNRTDLLIKKYDSNGTLLWTNTLASSYYQEIGDFIRTSDSNYMIAVSKYISSYYKTDGYLIKISDTDGTVMWSEDYRGTGYDGYYGGYPKVIEAADGGFLLLMNTNSSYVNNHQNPGQASATVGIYTSIYIARLDSLGRVVWDKMYGGSSSDFVLDGFRNDSSYIIFLQTSSTNITGVTRSDTVHGEGVILVLSDSGDIIKQTLLDMEDISNSVSDNFSFLDAAEYDSVYIVIGRTRETSYTDLWPAIPASGSELFIMTVDKAGDTIMNGRLGGNYFNGNYPYYGSSAVSIIPTSDGGFILAGSTTKDLNGVVTNLEDHLIMKLDSSFALQWTRVYAGGSAGDNSEAIRDIAEMPDGSLLCIGIHKSGSYDDLQIFRLTVMGY